MKSTGRRWLATAALSMLLSVALASAAQANTGDLLRSFTAANPEGCGVNVGIAFDGTNLVVSCVSGDRTGNTFLDFINPANGSLVRSLPVHRPGLAALAYDAGRGKLWACDNPSGTNNPGSGTKLFLIDPVSGAATDQFTTRGCWDGLAYDGADDTLWVGPDQSDTIYHYTSSGRLIGSHSGLVKELGGFGKSGIAVGGPSLYLANADGGAIYSAPKNFSTPPSRAATESGQHLEDMECDSVTFAPKDAMWVISAFDRILNAYEIPSGSCGVGGRAVAHVSPIPPLGSENFTPHGTVFVLIHGKWVKLTQTMQLPSGTEVDTLHGSLSLVANSGAGGGKASDARAKKPKKPKTFTGTFSGAVFKVIQKKFGRDRGLTTIQLVDRTPAFRGAPSYATTCRARGSADASAARLSRRVIYTLRSRSRGRWRSSGRSAAGTVGGTVWTTTDRCDGTLITAQVDNVLVNDLIRHIKILLHPHQHYLALLHPKKH